MESPKTGIEFVRSIGRDKLAELFGHNGEYTLGDDTRVSELLQVPASYYSVEVTPNVIKQARHEFGMKSFEKKPDKEPKPAAPPQPSLFPDSVMDEIIVELRVHSRMIRDLCETANAIKNELANIAGEAAKKTEYNLPPMFDVPPFPDIKRKVDYTVNA
jgi:hypothetical protein